MSCDPLNTSLHQITYTGNDIPDGDRFLFKGGWMFFQAFQPTPPFPFTLHKRRLATQVPEQVLIRPDLHFDSSVHSGVPLVPMVASSRLF
jgi:hypothetical protein